jgi:hypothetical protein
MTISSFGAGGGARAAPEAVGGARPAMSAPATVEALFEISS